MEALQCPTTSALQDTRQQLHKKKDVIRKQSETIRHLQAEVEEQRHPVAAAVVARTSEHLNCVSECLRYEGEPYHHLLQDIYNKIG